MLCRDAILEAVAKYFPELLHFAAYTIDQPSNLQFGEFVLKSEESTQHGIKRAAWIAAFWTRSWLTASHGHGWYHIDCIINLFNFLGIQITSIPHCYSYSPDPYLSLILVFAITFYFYTANVNDCAQGLHKSWETASQLGLLCGQTQLSPGCYVEMHGLSLPETSSSTVILLSAPLSADSTWTTCWKGREKNCYGCQWDWIQCHHTTARICYETCLLLLVLCTC